MQETSNGQHLTPPRCQRLEGLYGVKIDVCGLPEDPKSLKLTGEHLCPEHLQDELKETMSS